MCAQVPSPQPPSPDPAPTSPWSWLAAFALVSILTLTTYVAVQQVLRYGADDPQVQLAEDAAARLAEGAAAGTVVTPQRVDLARSQAPFVTVVRGTAEVLATNAMLHGGAPLPPAGVLTTALRTGGDRVTWQPERRVRIALIAVRVSGRSDLVVLSGRSLREVERRVAAIGTLFQGAWLAAMALLAVAWWLGARKRRVARA